MYEVLLASSSPRRSMLLRAAGVAVRVVAPHIDELWPGGAPQAAVVQLAWQKMRHVMPADSHAQPLSLAADTMVVLRGEPLGKPANAAAARHMLRALSGEVHQVMTGFVCCLAGAHRARCVTTHVRFRPLRDTEIDAYIASGEPFDKAGGYGIQGLGGALTDSVSGSYTNVIGLPLSEVLADFAALQAG